MPYQGTLENWNDERGFGFVEAAERGTRVFVHIKAFQQRHRRPVDGDVIVYDIEFDSQNRAQAVNIRFCEVGIQEESGLDQMRPIGWDVFFAAAFLGVLLTLTLLKYIPVFVALFYLLMSVIAFFVYGFDKLAAMGNRWRTKESTLQALAFFGGWPGALLGQKMFRHKTRKKHFQLFFWLLVCLNCGFFACTLLLPGSQYFRSWRESIRKPQMDLNVIPEEGRLPLIKPRNPSPEH